MKSLEQIAFDNYKSKLNLYKIKNPISLVEFDGYELFTVYETDIENKIFCQLWIDKCTETNYDRFFCYYINSSHLANYLNKIISLLNLIHFRYDEEFWLVDSRYSNIFDENNKILKMNSFEDIEKDLPTNESYFDRDLCYLTDLQIKELIFKFTNGNITMYNEWLESLK